MNSLLFSRTELAGLVLVSTVVYAIVTAVYRVTFHPLAKYPGPWLGRISGWPEAFRVRSGSRHIHHLKLHEIYGPVVRYAPDSLSFNTPQALHDIYADRDANVVKTGWTTTSQAVNHSSSIHTQDDKKLHAQRRRLIGHAFSDSAIRSAEGFVLDRIRAWCGCLGDDSSGNPGWSQSKDMSRWTTLLTLDVLGELCFGASFGAIEAGKSTILRLLIESTKLFQLVAYLPIAKLVEPILGNTTISALIGGQINRDRIGYRVKIAELVAERRALEAGTEKESRKDFFHYLLRAKDPQTGATLSNAELVAEAALLVGAGTDTSSTTLSGMLFYLMQNPRVLVKLTAELREAFSEVEEIVTGPKLSNLRYLRACVEEALRITPPLPGILTRKVQTGGALIDGHHLLAGTVVGASAYVVHHNEDVYEKSFEYLPERWIEGEQDAPFPVISESVALAKSAFFAFSQGTRGCIGKNIAYMELYLAVARLVWLFEMRVAGESGGGRKGFGEGREREGEYQVEDWFIVERKGPVLEFRRRVRDARMEKKHPVITVDRLA